MITTDDPGLARRTGRGVSIAVLDSGAHPDHPHLAPLAGGIALTPDRDEHADLVDRLGHGTAVTAAIQEKAPEADVYIVRVFHDVLATSARTLAQAIDWASENGCRVANLSLGTPHAFRVEELGPAVERAVERGTIVVSAFEHDDERWLPGSLPGALGVCLDWEIDRHAVRVVEVEDRPVVFASGFPRPIPGVPRERNLKGISFAVANTTGMLALALEARPEVRSAEDAASLLGGRG